MSGRSGPSAHRPFPQTVAAARLFHLEEHLAATRDKPFAGLLNVGEHAEHWTDSFSHGVLLRARYDERMEVDCRTGNKSVDICGNIEHQLHNSQRSSKWLDLQTLAYRNRLPMAGRKSPVVILFVLAICVTGCPTPRWVKFRADQSNTG